MSATVPNREDDLATLRAESAIRRSLGEFARIIDGRCWPDLPSVFLEDVVFDYGLGRESGLNALQATMARFLDRCGGTQHLIGSIIVEVRQAEATSRSYVQARHQRPNDVAGPVFDSNGEYVDRWTRSDAGWRIVERHVSWMVHSGDPGILDMDARGLA